MVIVEQINCSELTGSLINFKAVNNFIYLESTINDDVNGEKEIHRRISMVTNAVNRL